MSKGGWKEPKVDVWATCPVCGKLFNRAKTHRRKFCSDRCQRDNYNNKKRSGYYKHQQTAPELETRINWGMDYGRRQMEETLRLLKEGKL